MARSEWQSQGASQEKIQELGLSQRKSRNRFLQRIERNNGICTREWERSGQPCVTEVKLWSLWKLFEVWRLPSPAFPGQALNRKGCWGHANSRSKVCIVKLYQRSTLDGMECQAIPWLPHSILLHRTRSGLWRWVENATLMSIVAALGRGS